MEEHEDVEAKDKGEGKEEKGNFGKEGSLKKEEKPSGRRKHGEKEPFRRGTLRTLRKGDLEKEGKP